MPVKTQETWSKKVTLAKNSFLRAKESKFFPYKFYENLFSLKPELKKYFLSTDFEHQHKALINGLGFLFGYLNNEDKNSRDQIKRLAQVHSKNSLNIHPHEYHYWSEALILTVKELDPEWTDPFESHLREVVSYPLSFFISYYFL